MKVALCSLVSVFCHRKGKYTLLVGLNVSDAQLQLRAPKNEIHYIYIKNKKNKKQLDGEIDLDCK